MPLLNPAFEAYYCAAYGSRWEALRQSLFEGAPPAAYTHNLTAPYLLDRASILAAESLRLPATGEVLDACAAPGGKSLIIASRLTAETRLLANELSAGRRRRLVTVLDEHLDESRRAQVTVSGFDAAALAGRNFPRGSTRKHEHGRFAAVLLDAPCSSEAHVIQSDTALAQWTPARPRFLAGRQWALLSAAFLLLGPGGSLVYATCALAPEENDSVAARLVKKYGATVIIDPPDFPEGEKTEYGRIILPDVCGGIGPMYVARFRKDLSPN